MLEATEKQFAEIELLGVDKRPVYTSKHFELREPEPKSKYRRIGTNVRLASVTRHVFDEFGVSYTGFAEHNWLPGVWGEFSLPDWVDTPGTMRSRMSR